MTAKYASAVRRGAVSIATAAASFLGACESADRSPPRAEGGAPDASDASASGDAADGTAKGDAVTAEAEAGCSGPCPLDPAVERRIDDIIAQLTLDEKIELKHGIVHAFYPGAQGGNALAGILFGDVNPSGKLPVTVPTSEAQLPPFDNTSAQVTYGFFHGYRYVDHDGDTPRFPFGFGLSYTTFSYSNIVLSSTTMPPGGSVTVTADITNTGAVDGDEIVEMYVGAQGSSVERAVRDLKGFERVHLAKGEKRTVSFALAAADLAYYADASSAWVVEPIDYVVSIGTSSRTLPLTATVGVR